MTFKPITVLLAAVLAGSFRSMPIAEGAPSETFASSTKSTPVFSCDADPSFVLKVDFRVVKSQGSSFIVVHRAAGDDRVVLGAGHISLISASAPKLRWNSTVNIAAANFAAVNELLLTRRPNLLRVTLNGRTLLEMHDSSSTVNGANAAQSVSLDDPLHRLALVGEPRYQPTEPIYLADDFMVLPNAPSHWQSVAGTWHVAGVERPNDAADPFKFLGFASEDGVAINKDSRWFWSDYQVDAAVHPVDDKAGAGIVFDYRGPRDYFAFCWNAAAGPNGELQLWHLLGERIIPLASRKARARNGQWYHLAVHGFGTNVTAYVDETPVLAAADLALSGGQCGLFVNGDPGAEFDDFLVQSATDQHLMSTDRAAGNAWQDRTFATDTLMASWGSAEALWEPSAQADQRWYWYRGVLYHGAHIHIEPVPGQDNLGIQEIAMFAGDQSAGGIHLYFADGKIAATNHGKKVAAAALEAPKQLDIDCDEGGLTVRVEGRTVLNYRGDMGPLAGRVGLRWANSSLAAVAAAASVDSRSLREYRFDNAPVDWSIESGIWQSTTRWACVPNWSFFGGKGTPTAAIWNKRRYGGDQWIEAFVAPREGSTDWAHFSFPVNLNITFCAGSERTNGGYSLVYRTHDMSTVLYRLGVPVASTSSLVMPNWRNNPGFVYYRLEQTWHHLQIQRAGGRIRVWAEISSDSSPVPRSLLLDYTDPHPLAGDRLGLWTWGLNGMSIAQIRIAAQQISPPHFTPESDGNAVPNGVHRHVNEINGGSFRTDLISSPIDARSLSVVRFNYRAGADTRLALYAEAGGQRFRASFLGDVANDGDAIDMGRVSIGDNAWKRDGFGLLLDGAASTGKAEPWQHAAFALRQALRQFYPSGDLPRIEHLYVADTSNSPEDIGGLQVNSKGETFEWKAPEVPRVVRIYYPLPMLEWLTPNGNLPDAPLRLRVKDATSDPAKLAIAVNGHTLGLGQPGVSWNATDRVLSIDPTAAGLSFTDGQQVTANARASADSKPTEPSAGASWIYHRSTDKTLPTAPVVSTVNGPDRIDTFEGGLGAWRNISGERGATLWRDGSTAAGGHASLRLYHRGLTGMYGAMICDKPFDARRWPLFSFDYKMTQQLHISFIAEIGGRWYEIRMTDGDTTFPDLGAIANVRKDDQWHSAEFNLLQAVQWSAPGNTVVTRLFLGNTGIMNNLQDISWHLDNFRFVPALPSGRNGTLSWSATARGGIAGYAFDFDNSPSTVPVATVVPQTTSGAIPPNSTYLHVRAVDQTGIWGPTSHFRFALLPAGAPLPDSGAVTQISGQPEAKLPAPAVEVKLASGVAIDIESLHWRARASDTWREYEASTPALQYDQAIGVIRWRDPSLSPMDANTRPYSLQCELTANDLSGQPVLKGSWHWTVDASLDKSTPDAPYISYIPANCLYRSDFEHGLPAQAGIRRSSWVLPDSEDAATGHGSMRVVNMLENDFFGAFLHKDGWQVDRYPRIAFDYNFKDSGNNLNLVALVNGDMQLVAFTGYNTFYPVFRENTIGHIDGIQDARWHHADYDFGAMLRARYPDTPRFHADYLGTWATGWRRYQNPPGANLLFDNFTIYSPVATSAGFEWQPPQAQNGIRGYSCLLDQLPDTAPPAEINATETHRQFSGLKPGHYYFHVRACDRAGNWGPVAHLDFTLVAP